MRVDTYELIVPTAVEAVEVTTENLKEIAQWCRGDVWAGWGVKVPVARGEKVRTALVGWYVVKSHAGDFSVVEPAVFISKYKLRQKTRITRGPNGTAPDVQGGTNR